LTFEYDLRSITANHAARQISRSAVIKGRYTLPVNTARVYTGAFLTPVRTGRTYGCQKCIRTYGPYIVRTGRKFKSYCYTDTEIRTHTQTDCSTWTTKVVGNCTLGRIATSAGCGLLLQTEYSVVCLSVCLSVTTVSPAKATEPTVMPFGTLTRVRLKEPCIRWGTSRQTPTREEEILRVKRGWLRTCPDMCRRYTQSDSVG